MKEKLLAGIVLLSLLTPLMPINAAVLPGQEESGEGFFIKTNSYAPVSYATTSAEQVTKISADNGIIIKDILTTPQGNGFITSSSYNSQYLVHADYSTYPTKVNLYTKSGEKIDIPDQYEQTGCMAVGLKNEDNTKFVGCNTANKEIMVGRIINGQVRIQKTFKFNVNGVIGFNHEDFQGYNDITGKYLAFSVYTYGASSTMYSLNIETGEVKNISKQLTNAGFANTYSEAVGWRNNAVFLSSMSGDKTAIYKYNVIQNTIVKVGNVAPVTVCNRPGGLSHIALNMHNLEDKNIYMTIPCINQDYKYTYILSKMDIGTGKITELADTRNIPEFPNLYLGKFEFSSNGNFLGVNANSGNQRMIYRLNINTNHFGMIKYGAELI